MSEIIDDRDQLKKRFCEEFYKLAKFKGANSGFMDHEQYQTTIGAVKLAKIVKKKTPKQYRRVKRFDICSIGGVERLITPTQGSANFKCYVPNEDVFDIIHDTHLSIGHGGRTRMIIQLHKHYKNITQEIVAIYLSLCTFCQMKTKSAKKDLAVTPIRNIEVNSRCHVELIDMQSNPDGRYKFIFIYLDHSTKFVQLRPLKTKTAAEIASKILDIFCIFGAPMILHSHSHEFSNNLLNELVSMWPGLKLVIEKPTSQLQESIDSFNQDIEKILATWLQDNSSKTWSQGLKFVQMIFNRTNHNGTQQSPYKAMFGTDFKTGLLDSKLPQELIANISTEEELLNIIEETPKLTEEVKATTPNDDQANFVGLQSVKEIKIEALFEEDADPATPNHCHPHSECITVEADRAGFQSETFQVDNISRKAFYEVEIEPMNDKEIELQNTLNRLSNNVSVSRKKALATTRKRLQSNALIKHFRS